MKLYMNIPLKNKYNIMIPICRQYDLEVKGVVSGAKDLGIKFQLCPLSPV